MSEADDNAHRRPAPIEARKKGNGAETSGNGLHKNGRQSSKSDYEKVPDFDKGYLEHFQGWSYTEEIDQTIEEELKRDQDWVQSTR